MMVFIHLKPILNPKMPRKRHINTHAYKNSKPILNFLSKSFKPTVPLNAEDLPEAAGVSDRRRHSQQRIWGRLPTTGAVKDWRFDQDFTSG